jgi:menaquinone reductase, multiheme cytochrome c subunit
MRCFLFTSALFAVMIGILACGTVLRGRYVAALPEEPGPHFDHAGHMKKGIECADCHGGEKEEWRAMPELKACMECHEDLDGEAPPEKRASAFFDADGKRGLWVPSRALGSEVIFPHGAHVVAHGKKCDTCHAQVIASTGQTTSTWINMDACIECHETSAPQHNRCESCHREISQDVRPASHTPAWKRTHGRMAREGELDKLPKDCALCHSKSDCDTCHRAEMPANHTNFFRLRGHATLASIDRDRCRVCHTTDSCFLCHQHTKPRNHTGTFGSPFNRHCLSCHLPLESFEDQGCYVCHKSSPGHAMAPPRPANAVHMTSDPAACRVCHSGPTLGHPDNGQSCLLCHQ